MNVLQALILGIVQGATEFLPVSSSAHLRIAKTIMGIADGEHLLYFDLICHSGTLIALILYLRKEIYEALSSLKTIRLFALGLTPLVPAYFLLKPLRIAASDPSYLGYFLIVTSSLLFIASKKRALCPEMQYEGSRAAPRSDFSSCSSIKYKDVLWIGVMQTMALLPGISRSGSTIAAARLLGWNWIKAARFSFLLAIPAVLGGQMLETFKLIYHPTNAEMAPSIACYLAAFATSLIVGMIGVRFIFKIYAKGNVAPFAWYCLFLGITAAWAFHG